MGITCRFLFSILHITSRLPPSFGLRARKRCGHWALYGGRGHQICMPRQYLQSRFQTRLKLWVMILQMRRSVAWHVEMLSVLFHRSCRSIEPCKFQFLRSVPCVELRPALLEALSLNFMIGLVLSVAKISKPPTRQT